MFAGAIALGGCPSGGADTTGFDSITQPLTGGAETGSVGETGEPTSATEPPLSTSTGDSSTGEVTGGSTTTGDSSESGASEAGEAGCVDGTPECPCLPDKTCGDGLMCEADVCVPLAAVCGDGMVAGDEQCDAGADNGDDKQCKSDCTAQECGDAFVGPGEACDDGNMVDDDACSNTCVPAACGDMVVQMGEACDDGNMVNTDACVACEAAACGDTFVQAGVEACDDGNLIAGDGCDAACKVEVPMCGKSFTTDWCPQVGTKEQFTRCDAIANGGKTCNNPTIRYGTVEGGVPASHVGNDLVKWCQQLGFAGFAGQVSYGSRPCPAPGGKLFGCMSYDEMAWHWCDWKDGAWYNQSLNLNVCDDGAEITSITCQ